MYAGIPLAAERILSCGHAHKVITFTKKSPPKEGDLLFKKNFNYI